MALAVFAALAITGLQLASAADSAPTPNRSETVRLPAPDEVADRVTALSATLKALSQEMATRSETANRGATPDELAERDGLYKRWTAAIDSQINVLRRLQKMRQTIAQYNAEIKAWQGFPEKPPYPLSMAEELRDQLGAQVLEERSLQMALSTGEDTAARQASALADRQKELRLLKESILDKGGSTNRDRWSIELADLRVKVAQATLETTVLSRLANSEILRGRRDYERFIKTKLDQASAQTRFEQQDLDAALARVKTEQNALQQEINEALAAENGLRGALDDARLALQKAQEKPAAPGENIAELQGAVDLAQARIDANELRVEVLRTLVSLCNRARLAWEDRFWLRGTHTLAELHAKEEEYQPRLENLPNWQKLAESRLNAAAVQALAFGTKARNKDLPPAERELARQIQATWEERAGMYQRQLVGVSAVGELNARLLAELGDLQQNLSSINRVGFLREQALNWLYSFWNTEIYVAEDSVITDGQRIPVSRSITIGKILLALLIVSLSFMTSGLVRKRVRRMATRWFADARQIQLVVLAAGVTTIVAGIVIAMASVRIPWSVFAFAGGAIAIGVGLGAQTAVKNLLTGVMMVFSGHVRPGDIIEMDGHCGEVKKIGASRSLLRRPDGVELLVPNSRFVEQTLINWTHTDNLVRQSITVSAAYGSSPRQVSELLARAASESAEVLKTPAPDVLFDDFGVDGLVFVLRFWLQIPPTNDGAVVRSNLRHRVSVLFEQAGVQMPFTQRAVHLDTVRPLTVQVLPAEATRPVQRANTSG